MSDDHKTNGIPVEEAIKLIQDHIDQEQKLSDELKSFHNEHGVPRGWYRDYLLSTEYTDTNNSEPILLIEDPETFPHSLFPFSSEISKVGADRLVRDPRTFSKEEYEAAMDRFLEDNGKLNKTENDFSKKIDSINELRKTNAFRRRFQKYSPEPDQSQTKTSGEKEFVDKMVLLAGFVLNRDIRDGVIGDMLEKYEVEKSKYGAYNAQWFLARDVAASYGPLLKTFTKTQLFRLLKAVGLHEIYKYFIG